MIWEIFQGERSCCIENQLHIRHLALAMVALAVSMTAMAQTELEDLVNTRWEVGLSKVGWDTEDCTDDTCLKGR